MKFLNKLVCIDVLEGLKELPENSIDLVLTSPPYATIRESYEGVEAEKYAAWFTPILKEILRVLTPNGSFILNINDKCKKGERIPFPFEIVIKAREIGLKYIDTIIWGKKNGIAGAGRRRADYFEYIFHLAKSVKPTWNPDPIRTPYTASSINRAKTPIKNNVSNRESRSKKQDNYKKWKLHPMGAFPKNIQYFKKDSGKNHVASFHIELPTHFIQAHSNAGETVLDPFAGRGTTCAAAQILGRNYIGFDLKKEHVELGEELYNLDIN
jgi:DNA modification methylase